MANYRATKTAQNIKIEEKDYESLEKLVIFATTLQYSQDLDEIKETISFLKSINEDYQSKLNSVEDFKKMQNEKWNENQNISDIISILVDILSNSDFFDTRENLVQIFQEYSIDLQKKEKTVTELDLNTINITNKDFALQFYEEEREFSNAEKYANLMYLANQLAHALQKTLYQKNSTGIKMEDTKYLIKELMNIKNSSIHKLIELKSKGQNIAIAISEDIHANSKYNNAISFYLPNYFEPFCVHFDASILSKSEIENCTSEDLFRKFGLKTTFPQYISPQKNILLEKVYSKYFHGGSSIFFKRGYRLKSFFESQKNLAKQKSNIKSEPSKIQKNYRGNSKNTEAITTQRENKKVLKLIEDALEFELPEYFKEGFLSRTNYSIYKYMEAVSTTIKEDLLSRGISENNLDKEFAKFIIYMKMTKPLSTISLKNKDLKIENARECLDGYLPVTNFILGNICKETDYKKLKSATRKYEESKLKQTNEKLDKDSNTSNFEHNDLTMQIANLSVECDELAMKIKDLSDELSKKQHKLSILLTKKQVRNIEDKGDIDVND